MDLENNKSPAKELERFLSFVDSCTGEYRLAFDSVGEEDKKLQDLLHEMEFAADKAERNRVATRLQQSRRNRRKEKDTAQKYELIVKFFEDQNNRATLNRLRQLLGRQRKEEEFLASKRTYKPRVEKNG